MSVQFGRWNFEDQPPNPDYIEKVSGALAPYGPDSNESYSKGGIKILYRAFHTTNESRRENQPCISPSGAVVTWDGRLDNRADLIRELRDSLTVDSTDVAIVAAAYEKWKMNCMGKLIGDWALSIWNPRDRSVLLAKDPIGTKHLYYSFDDNHLAWSTILDPLVLFAGTSFEICEEYIAGWFAAPAFPAAHLTPYVGIHAVPPSSSVLLRPGKHIVSKYWDFDPSKRIRYRTDAEYEESFRGAFATAVQRRLRSDRPVLAELSGGIDSSSIVCMADLAIAHGQGACPRLDTITWYDVARPNWGELANFTKIEEKRGRIGYRIDLSSSGNDNLTAMFEGDFEKGLFAPTPIPTTQSTLFKRTAAYMKGGEYRVTLSGIGGELTGDGVPTPIPEFQNLLARVHLFTLARQLKAWAEKMRTDRLPLLLEAVRGFFPLSLQDVPKYSFSPPPWLDSGFVRRNRAALSDYPFRVKLLGPLPSFQHSLRTLNFSRRLFSSWPLHSDLLTEVRFPYFDRDFLEFMCAIPREQVVGVGQRRFLMKRALVGIVPEEVLNRRKKEIVGQRRVKGTLQKWPRVHKAELSFISSSIRIIDSGKFWSALQAADVNEASVERLTRVLTLGLWLRQLFDRDLLKNSMSIMKEDHSSHSDNSARSSPTQIEPKELPMAVQPHSSAS